MIKEEKFGSYILFFIFEDGTVQIRWREYRFGKYKYIIGEDNDWYPRRFESIEAAKKNGCGTPR